jgi:hypothetical protein
MESCRRLLAVTAVLMGLVFPATAVANPTGQITRAASTPDGAHGSFAGSVTYDGSGCADPCHWRAFLTVQPWRFEPPLYNCNAGDWSYSGDPSVLVAWESSDQTTYPATVAFDGQDFPIVPNVADQRVCLYIAYTSGPEEETVLIIPPSLTFTVDPPTGGGGGGGSGGGGGGTGGGGSAGSTPSTQQKTQTLSLSKQQATSRAKSALARKYGRAYKRGKRRLSCKRQSSSAYRCSFSIRYRKKRHSGSVTVRATTAGIKATVRAR